MKKILPLLLIIGAAFGSFYYYKNHMAPDSASGNAEISAGSASVLRYVPADTILFSGSTSPFPLKKFFDSSPRYSSASNTNMDELPADARAGGKLFMQIINDYSELVNKGDWQQMGLAAENNSALFLVGLIPVARLHLDDPEKFKNFIEQAKTKAGVTSNDASIGAINYQSFPLEDDVHLVISYQDNYAVMTIKADRANEELLAKSLGATMPAKSLAETGIISGMLSRYKILSEALFFVSTENFIASITSTEENDLKSTIALLDDSNKASLAMLSTPECQSELKQVSTTWPGIFAGYTRLELDSSEVIADFEMHVEYNNKVIIDALRALRGFLPSKFTSDTFGGVMGIAMALNANNVLSSLTQIWEEISKSNYQCEPLKEINTSLVQSNPAGFAGMTGMVAGLQGVSLSLNKLDMVMDANTGQPQINGIDALVTLSADNPSMLLATASTMVPFLNGMQAPANGETIDFPMPIPMIPVQPKLSLFGKHLTLTLGDEALNQAKAMRNEALDSNGMMSYWMNTKKFFGLIMPSIQQYAVLLGESGNDMQSAFQQMMEADANVNIYTDITEKSFLIGARSTMKKP